MADDEAPRPDDERTPSSDDATTSTDAPGDPAAPKPGTPPPPATNPLAPPRLSSPSGKRTTAFSDLLRGGPKSSTLPPLPGGPLPSAPRPPAGVEPSAPSPSSASSASLKREPSMQLGASLGLKLGSSSSMTRASVTDGDEVIEDLSMSEMEVVDLEDDAGDATDNPANATAAPPPRSPPPRGGPPSRAAPAPSSAPSPATPPAPSPAPTPSVTDDERRLAAAAGLLGPSAAPGDAAPVHWAASLGQRGNGDARRVTLTWDEGRAFDEDAAARVATRSEQARAACDLVVPWARIDGGDVRGFERGRPELRSLRQVSLADTLDLARSVGVVRQLARVLRVLEAAGVEHLALSADAVLLDADDHLLLTDMGLGSVVDFDDDATSGEFTPHLPETAVGMPPERGDVYGFGCVAYFALTGRPVFRDVPEQTGQQRRRHAIEEPDPLKRDGALLPRPLNAFIQACLSKEPSDRPADAAAVCEQLEAALTEAGIEGTFTHLELSAESIETKNSAEAAAAAGALVARASESGEQRMPPREAAVRYAGTSMTQAPVPQASPAEASAAAATAATAARPPADARDAAGLAEFELDKAKTDWAARKRLLMPFGLAVGTILLAILGVSMFGQEMAREGEAYKEAEAEALARGEVPERWRAEASPSDAAVAVEFPEGAPPPAAQTDPEPQSGDISVEGETGGDTAGDTAGDTTGDTAEQIAAHAGDATTTGAPEPEPTPEPEPEPTPEPESTPEPEAAPQPAPTPAPAPAPTQSASQLASRAASALRSGSTSTAKSLYKQALGVNSRHVPSLEALSDIYFDEGSFSTAARYLRRLVSARPSDGTYRVLLGDAYYKAGQYAKAAEAYQKAVDLGVSSASKRLAKAKSKL